MALLTRQETFSHISACKLDFETKKYKEFIVQCLTKDFKAGFFHLTQCLEISIFNESNEKGNDVSSASKGLIIAAFTLKLCPYRIALLKLFF